MSFRSKLSISAVVVFYLALISHIAAGQRRVLDIGYKAQKSVDFYLEHGLSFEYCGSKTVNDHLYAGISYLSGRLGGDHSSALSHNKFIGSGAWYFWPERVVRPLVKGNVSYFLTKYKTRTTDHASRSMFQVSMEGGVAFDFNSPFKLVAAVGYNLFAGENIHIPGTIPSLYFQTSTFWDVFKDRRM